MRSRGSLLVMLAFALGVLAVLVLRNGSTERAAKEETTDEPSMPASVAVVPRAQLEPVPSAEGSRDDAPTAGGAALPLPSDEPQLLAGLSAGVSAPRVRKVISEQLLSWVTDERYFPELASCSDQHGLHAPQCAVLLDTALSRAFDWRIGRDLGHGGPYGIDRLLEVEGRTEAARNARLAVLQTLSESDDPIERVSSLALSERLASESTEPQPALPATVFEGIKERTHLERAFLLNAFEQAPTTDGHVLEELSELALSERYDIPERRQALRAVAASGAGEAFENLLREAQRSVAISQNGALQVLGPGLARCGFACGGTLRRLAADSDTNARLAVLSALARMDEAPFEALGRELLPALRAPNAPSAIEQDQLAFVEKRFSRGGRR